MILYEFHEKEFLKKAIKFDPHGEAAAVIGEVVDDHPGKVFLKTRIGGKRIVDMLAGEQLPRIF